MISQSSITILFFFKTIILILSWVYGIILLDNSVNGLISISILTLFSSMITVHNVKKDKCLLILFSIIAYINLSAIVLGGITKGLALPSWQLGLWNSEYNTIYMKCLLLTNIVFALGTLDAEKKALKYDINDILETKKPNLYLSIFSLAVLSYIVIFSFDGSSVYSNGNYASNTNALYEYAIFFFSLAWIYGRKFPICRIFLYFLAFIYIFQGFVTGDRSSCFMLIIIIALVFFQRIKINKLLILTFMGITVSNLISSFRHKGIEGLTLADKGLLTFFSDTVGYSCYTGLTITYLSDHFLDDKFNLFCQWVLSIFIGSSFLDKESYQLVNAAKLLNYNGGGGMFPAYFYFYGGLLGVTFAAFITILLLRYVYYHSISRFGLILRFVLPSMVLRWYLYSPVTLFRSCFINFFIIYILYTLFDSSLRKQETVISKSIL